ncbi:hypothetical protein, conserved [Plasmodium gonderi]|uniref:Uncharacterized protein n=1 Tax=Plasmodium gonderi TaxID=77519 RepID=A0A1Y1JQA8_PLAGO|nr:hypothetical protein, conserved [Plasmodium gonderi]GAW83688.1 hypothetical protein, conserved [Plasmodium gonderi]
MLWKHFSKVPHMLLGKGGIRKTVLKFMEIKRAFKLIFKLIYRSNFHKFLNKVTTKIIKLYAKCVNNSSVFRKLCNKYYKISHLKITICDFFFKNKIINAKLKKCSIIKPRCYKQNKINGITNKMNKYTEEGICAEESNDHYVIDLYNETHLQTPFNNAYVLKSNDSTFESNCNTTQSSDCGRTNENDETSNSSYLDNDMLSFETLEYDEDEVNENIKNCYLYNGYVNVKSYKNSEEYKFLNHLNEEKNKCVDIAIDVSPQCYYDEQLENEKGERAASGKREKEENCNQTDDEMKHAYKKRRKRKNKIYEIYNSETTVKQNIYCENYLNDNYSSSYDCSSEYNDDTSVNDFSDNYFDDISENSFLCQYSVNSYDTIQSAQDESN